MAADTDPLREALNALAGDAPAAPELAPTLRRIRRRRARTVAVSLGGGAAAALAAALALPALLPAVPGTVEEASSLSEFSADATVPEADDGQNRLREGLGGYALTTLCPAPDTAWQEHAAAPVALLIDGLSRAGAAHPEGSLALELRLAPNADPRRVTELTLWLFDDEGVAWQGSSLQDAGSSADAQLSPLAPTTLTIAPAAHCTAGPDGNPLPDPAPAPGRYRVLVTALLEVQDAAQQDAAAVSAEGELFLP